MLDKLDWVEEVAFIRKLVSVLRTEMDPKDNHILELAVASQIKTIVTYNIKDFKGTDKFGIQAITPKTLLEKLK